MLSTIKPDYYTDIVDKFYFEVHQSPPLLAQQNWYVFRDYFPFYKKKSSTEKNNCIFYQYLHIIREATSYNLFFDPPKCSFQFQSL